MGKLRIGTCSWKYGSWKDLVYSASKGINFLEEYAARYNTVEIDPSLSAPIPISCRNPSFWILPNDWSPFVV